MRKEPTTCPVCDSLDVACYSVEFDLFKCRDCGERFSTEEGELRERSSRNRTRPRRYEDEDEDG